MLVRDQGFEEPHEVAKAWQWGDIPTQMSLMASQTIIVVPGSAQDSTSADIAHDREAGKISRVRFPHRLETPSCRPRQIEGA